MKRLTLTIVVLMALLSCSIPPPIPTPIPAPAQQDELPPDYSLHDLWVLIEIDGQSLDSTGFDLKGAPQFEFYSEEGRLAGHTGCNNFNTTFKVVEPGVIDVAMAASTRMRCENMEIENLLIQDFLGHRLHHQVENLRFTLTNERGKTVKFMKIN